ncbi:MAG: hypothetical protein JO227_14560 [Acetobacteraceae bacterium]|nr:hypothetical protein [Acetobacteraceae bacterium]
MPGVLPLVGFVFREDWAYQSPVVISGFLKAAVAAEALLSSSEVAWEPIRPLMDAADAALFVRLQRAFIEGIAHPPAAAQDQAAAKLFDVLLRTGGPRATGGLEKLPQGIFWANRE